MGNQYSCCQASSQKYNQIRNLYTIIKKIKSKHNKQIYLVISNTQQIHYYHQIIYKKPLRQKQLLNSSKKIQLLKQFKHPNFISLIKIFIQPKKTQNNHIQKYLHIISEAIDEKNYTLLSKVDKKFTNQQILIIYQQLKSAIEALNQIYLVHGNLKLQNIWINQNLEIKIQNHEDAVFVKNHYGWIQVNSNNKYSNFPQVKENKLSINSDLWCIGDIINILWQKSNCEIVQRQLPLDIKKIVAVLKKNNFKQRTFYSKQQQLVIQISNPKNIKSLQQKININMKILSLQQYNIGDTSIQKLCNSLKHLKQLNLNYNNVGDRGAKLIAQKLKNLQILLMKKNKIGDVGIAQISHNLSRLLSIDISENMIGQIGLNHIYTNLKNVSGFSLNNNKNNDKNNPIIYINIKQITNNFKNILQLHLHNQRIDQEGAKLISQNLRKLIQLDIQCNNIGDNGVTQIVKHLDRIEILRIGDNGIKSQGIIGISQKMSNIRVLDLNNNNITNQCMGQFIKNVAKSKINKLSQLNLQKNQIGSQVALNIVTKIKTLTYINLKNNPIQQDYVIIIAEVMRNKTIFI